MITMLLKLKLSNDENMHDDNLIMIDIDDADRINIDKKFDIIFDIDDTNW